jgi:hypothetical protein
VKRSLTYALDDAEKEALNELGKKKKKRNDRKQPRFSVENFPLPDFSDDVMTTIISKKIDIHTAKFIDEATRHLRNTIEYPTPTEYSNYTDALMAAHPLLAHISTNLLSSRVI